MAGSVKKQKPFLCLCLWDQNAVKIGEQAEVRSGLL